MKPIVIMGPPGSGKSSLAAAFVEHTGDAYSHISSGEIARSLARLDDSTETALRHGEYAPEAAMRSEVCAHIEAAMGVGKIPILDGFPRTFAQLMIVESIIPEPLYLEVFAEPYTCLRRVVERARSYDLKPDAVATVFESYERDTRPLIEMLKPYQIPNVDKQRALANLLRAKDEWAE